MMPNQGGENNIEQSDGDNSIPKSPEEQHELPIENNQEEKEDTPDLPSPTTATEEESKADHPPPPPQAEEKTEESSEVRTQPEESTNNTTTTNNDDDTSQTKVSDEDNDDDYDPETNFPLSPEEDKKPASSMADSVIQSVLTDYQQKKDDKNTTTSVDLNKLLSTMSSSANNNSTESTSATAAVAAATSTDSASSPPVVNVDEFLDKPFTDHENEMYQKFIQEEEEYVTSGLWDKYPQAARMFVGNLPQDRISKPQIFKLFHKYGPIVQISLKKAYGFIQFHDSSACHNAIEGEKNSLVKGNHLHLEMSKPQQPRNNNKRERSKSPNRRNNNRGGKRNKKNNNNYRDRSPQRGRRGGGGGNWSPPECQIFVVDRLDKGFVYYIEKFFKDAGISVAIEDMNRSRIKDSTSQMAHDGVLGVLTLDFQSQNTGQLSIQVFEQGAGGNVRFDEYLNIYPMVAVELINRVKRNRFGGSRSNHNSPPPQGQPPMPAYPPALPQNMPFPQPNNNNWNNPNAANLLGTLQNMDPASLQKVIGMIQQQQPQSQQQQPPPMPYNNMPPQQQFMPPPPPQQSQSRPPPPHQQQRQQPSGSQSTEQVQNIMEQLAKLQGQVGK